jgi:hypothetical protein
VFVLRGYRFGPSLRFPRKGQTAGEVHSPPPVRSALCAPPDVPRDVPGPMCRLPALTANISLYPLKFVRDGQTLKLICMKMQKNSSIRLTPVACNINVLWSQFTTIMIVTWGQYNKTFYGRNLRIFRNKQQCLSLESLSSLVQ